MQFKLVSSFSPTGDQPEAIRQLVDGIIRGDASQTLLGVTGSGKTFTMANVIEKVQMTTLVLSHNKTLASQLYGEFKQFFPQNAVEYFVSYYDYYQPEAFLPVTNTYIEKDLSVNDEIEKLRLSTTSSLLSGRNDIIVVASVSCIYGIGNPEDFYNSQIYVKKGEKISREKILHKLVEAMYSRTQNDLSRGQFRVRGGSVDVFLAYSDLGLRISISGNEIDDLCYFDPGTGRTVEALQQATIFPANIFLTSRDFLEEALHEIKQDLNKQVPYFIEQGRVEESIRLERRVMNDIEMMRELGYCSGIENYSRYFDRRKPGQRPFCLLDYFPKNYLLVVDESHATIPQIRGMYGGDRSRKQTLVDYGFRLPAALDNRPLNFNEFEGMMAQTIFVSATPADYELNRCDGVIVEQLIRPTGLPDPCVEVRPSLNQIDDLMEEIDERVKKKERVLVTTLTKRMAEELAKYFYNLDINCRYIHSDVVTLERVEILRDLRLGNFDVLVGINLLREGLDLPEVSLVAILDADKEGFLRSERSLTQIAGRAARHINGKVIMYADKITDSMQRMMDESNRRRAIQLTYNDDHNIQPKQILKSASEIIGQSAVLDARDKKLNPYIENEKISIAADPVVKYMSGGDIKKSIRKTRKAMEDAAKEFDFIEAGRLRDEMIELEKMAKRINSI